jgi:DnaJ-class molecular chaperone
MTACQVLGLQQNATQTEIRSAYKRLALKWHPDKHNINNVTIDTASGKFQEISEAYQLLSTNSAGTRRRTFTNAFDQFFGSRDHFRTPPSKQRKYTHTRPLCASLQVTLYDLLFQRTKQVSINNGLSMLVQCRSAWRVNGMYTLKSTKKQPLVFDNGTPCSAKLKLSVTIAPHPTFTRRDNDLYMTHSISLKQLLLGVGKMSVTDLDGKCVIVDWGAGIVNLGQPKIVPNSGMPKRHSIKNRGNLLIQPVLDVSISHHLTTKQRELLAMYL